ncbi:dihydroneopterin aldolase [Lutibaculum baratangense]|uniref:7,8-dihydroneopterin aldolase n=1 Tax=Lutibaculum baratangense AMV1 TaxID=631454 RepID=V4RDE9_9HYPH|nr:dihydroneopterin aldolase [Lutibaculum baratangense]ESR24186.1 Dihydroneopterin aldolase [Lutibaculum baratangense AMV1]
MRDTDTLLLRGIVVFARHGVYREEESLGQRFEIDLEARLDTRPFATADEPTGTADYAALYETVVETATARRFKLMEALGDQIARAVLARFEGVTAARVEIRKPSVPIPGVLSHAGCVICRDRRDVPGP